MSGFTIVDWKTSVSIMKIWQLQVSGGYRLLAESKGYKIDQCLSLRLDEHGGQAKPKEYGDLMDTAFFLRALDIYRFFHGPEMHRVSDILSPYVDKQWFDESSRIRGVEVHRACAAIAKGLWAPPLSLHHGYVESFERWFHDNVEEVVLVEERLECPELGFTGQPDLITRLKQGWREKDEGKE
jgi:hypothetical protein